MIRTRLLFAKMSASLQLILPELSVMLLANSYDVLSTLLVVLIFLVSGKEAYLEGPRESLLFAAMPQGVCQADNWGMPHQIFQPVASPGYFEKYIRVPCSEQFKNNEGAMSVLLPNATVIHSKSTADYDNFISTDWVPENRHLYGATSSWGNAKKFTFNAVAPQSMRASTCTSRTPDPRTGEPSQWTVTRIGPMRTRGGYDWVQIGWDDVWGMSAVLEQYPDGVFVMEQYMSPVYANGTRIEYPPLHIHHMHMGPAPYVRQRFDPVECLLHHTNCFDPSRAFETHGDYTCSVAQGGLDCRVESLPQGYARLVTQPMGIEGELNDVRAPGSPELEWYWEVGARWVPKTVKTSASSSHVRAGAHAAVGPSGAEESGTSGGYKPLSLHNFGGPGNYDMNVQKTLLFTFNIPTRHDSIFWYTGRMSQGGSLLRMKVHSHNNMFEHSVVFAASPEELGMTQETGWSRQNPHLALHPAELGFQVVDDVVAHVLQRLAESQASYDLHDGHSHREGQARPQVVCQSHFSLEVEQKIGYDRKCSTCCVPWEWVAGQIFTVLAVNVHHRHPVGLQSPRLEDVPAVLPGHVGYWLFYDSHETPARSNWGYSMYNHDPDGSSTATDIPSYQKVAMLLNKHTSPNWHDWRSTRYSLVGMAVVWLATHLVMGTLAMMLLVLIGCALARRVPRMLRSDYKKNDDCFCHGGVGDDEDGNFSGRHRDRYQFKQQLWQDEVELAGVNRDANLLCEGAADSSSELRSLLR